MTKKINKIVFKSEYEPESLEDLADTKFMTKERIESFGEQWWWIHVYAEAEIEIKYNFGSVIHKITAGGCGGIESDADNEYLKDFKIDAFNDLKSDLEQFGFKAKEIESLRDRYMSELDE